MKLKLTTTLEKIQSYSPCATGWKTLINSLGGIDSYKMGTEINLLKILDSNGVHDMLWCLRATNEDSRRISSELAIAFADEVLPIFEEKALDDDRPRRAIQAAAAAAADAAAAAADGAEDMVAEYKKYFDALDFPVYPSEIGPQKVREILGV